MLNCCKNDILIETKYFKKIKKLIENENENDKNKDFFNRF